MVFVHFLLIILLVYASVMDLKARRIPNTLCIFILFVGVISNSFLITPTGFYNSVAGFGVGLLSFLLLRSFTGLGAGDVKLMAAVGSVVGFSPILKILYWSFLFSGIFVLVFIVSQIGWKRVFRPRKKTPESLVTRQFVIPNHLAHYPFPMAPGIAIATAYMLLPELLFYFGN